MNAPLWTPSSERVAASRMTAFRHFVNQRHNLQLSDYPALHTWSIESRAAFWQAIADFFAVHFHQPAEQVLDEGPLMPDARWFPGATLNFAEHLLRRRDQHPCQEWICSERSRRARTANMKATPRTTPQRVPATPPSTIPGISRPKMEATAIAPAAEPSRAARRRREGVPNAKTGIAPTPVASAVIVAATRSSSITSD